MNGPQTCGCLVVMQPTFLPWAGYFNLMTQADVFVFLDDVQLERQSWQTRNRLLMNGRAQWVSVPIRHDRLSQTIAETETVAFGRWYDKFTRGFTQAYGKHPHFAAAREIVERLGEVQEARLGALNETVITHAAARLGLAPRFCRAGELAIPGVRSERLLALCQHFGARDYLSPVGAGDYLAEDGFASRSPATLRFQDYRPRPYRQKGAGAFVSHLSLLDVVANLGWDEARAYVHQGLL